VAHESEAAHAIRAYLCAQRGFVRAMVVAPAVVRTNHENP
jgi:hypothetical protein